MDRFMGKRAVGWARENQRETERDRDTKRE